MKTLKKKPTENRQMKRKGKERRLEEKKRAKKGLWSLDLQRCRRINNNSSGRRDGDVRQRSKNVGLSERFCVVASRGKTETILEETMRNKAGRFSGKCWWSSSFGFSSASLRYHTWELLSTVQTHRKNRVSQRNSQSEWVILSQWR